MGPASQPHDDIPAVNWPNLYFSSRPSTAEPDSDRHHWLVLRAADHGFEANRWNRPACSRSPNARMAGVTRTLRPWNAVRCQGWLGQSSTARFMEPSHRRRPLQLERHQVCSLPRSCHIALFTKPHPLLQQPHQRPCASSNTSTASTSPTTTSLSPSPLPRSMPARSSASSTSPTMTSSEGYQPISMSCRCWHFLAPLLKLKLIVLLAMTLEMVW
jgi:hypothetical protein